MGNPLGAIDQPYFSPTEKLSFPPNMGYQTDSPLHMGMWCLGDPQNGGFPVGFSFLSFSCFAVGTKIDVRGL